MPVSGSIPPPSPRRMFARNAIAPSPLRAPHFDERAWLLSVTWGSHRVCERAGEECMWRCGYMLLPITACNFHIHVSLVSATMGDGGAPRVRLARASAPWSGPRPNKGRLRSPIESPPYARVCTRPRPHRDLGGRRNARRAWCNRRPPGATRAKTRAAALVAPSDSTSELCGSLRNVGVSPGASGNGRQDFPPAR